MVFPRLKKRVNDFLVREEGRISRERLVKAGIVSGVFGLMLASEISQTSGQTTDPVHSDTPHSNNHTNTHNSQITTDKWSDHTNKMSVKTEGPKSWGEHNHNPSTHSQAHSNSGHNNDHSSKAHQSHSSHNNWDGGP